MNEEQKKIDMKALIYPPMVAVYYLLIALGIDTYLIEIRLVHPPYHLFGIAIIAIAAALMIWAGLVFNKNKTTLLHNDRPAALVTSGPFGFSRNPIYLGMALGLIGIAIFIGTVSLFFTPIAFVLTINWTYIPHEEKRLEQLFGKEYLNYMDRIRRWL